MNRLKFFPFLKGKRNIVGKEKRQRMFWTPSAWQWGSGWPSEPAVPGSNLNEARSAESDMHKLMRWKGSKGVIETTFIVRYSHLDTKRGILTYYVFPAPRIPSEHRWKSLSQLSSCRHRHHCRSCHGRHGCHRCVSLLSLSSLLVQLSFVWKLSSLSSSMLL